MKRFFSAVAFCTFLLGLGIYFLLPKTEAQNNILQSLLDLPSPPPPNPLIINRKNNRPDSFFSTKNPPSDDAPIEDIVDYWQFRGNSPNSASKMGFNAEFGFTPKISDKSVKRLYEEIENNPEKLNELLNILPKNRETTDLVKKIFDKSKNSENEYESEQLKNWLTFNSNQYSDALLEAAKEVKDVNGYLTNHQELLALAEVDWEKAKPLLERLANNINYPVSQTAAYWAYYQHALNEGNSIEAENYRKKLQAIVENKSLSAGNRDLAMDALVQGGDFEGRDDWYLSLYEDETLFAMKSASGGNYSGLMTMVMKDNPEKYKYKMIELVKSGNQNVRNAAIMNLVVLIDKENPEVIEALLPWLENPKWATEIYQARAKIIQILSEVELPESVNGLISVLNEKNTVQRRNYGANVISNTASNRPAVNSTPVADSFEVFPLRNAAVRALAKQKSPLAISALKQILPEMEIYQMSETIKAINACNGYSVYEQTDALVKVAKDSVESEVKYGANATTVTNTITSITMTANTVSEDGDEEEEEDDEVYGMPQTVAPPPRLISAEASSLKDADDSKLTYSPQTAQSILGSILAGGEDISDDLVKNVIVKIGQLRTNEPKTANALHEILKRWHGTAVNSLFMSELRENKADLPSIVKLLSVRKELKEKQISEVFEMRGGHPIAYGIAACLIDEIGEYEAVLGNDNAEAKTAMLGCARLIRANLQIEKVAEYLKDSDKTLAMAAERYIESVDTPLARQIVLANNPNKAKILGARSFFGYENSQPIEFLDSLFESVTANSRGIYDEYDDLNKVEKELQKELNENQEMVGAYALEDSFIRIYKDKAVFSWEEDSARYRERMLKRSEFQRLLDYVIYEKIDELPPFISDYCNSDHGESPCDNAELLMMSREGGRRVFVNNSKGKTKFLNELREIFADYKKPPAKLKYWLEKSVTGLEVLFADEKLKARTLYKNGDDFRVLIEDSDRAKNRDEEVKKQNESDEAKIDEGTDQIDYEKLEKIHRQRIQQHAYDEYSWRKFEQKKLTDIFAQPPQVEYIPKQDRIDPPASQTQWKARTATFELRGNDEGLYKIVSGVKTRIRTGDYSEPVVSLNGRWAVVTKMIDYEKSLVRVNLLTNKEFKIVNPTSYINLQPFAFIPSLNKFLIGDNYYTDGDIGGVSRLREKYLLDAETGVIQKVKGELNPIAQQSFRPLQSNGKPDQFWVAIPGRVKEETKFGIYNAKTLTFKPLLMIPKIRFDSMEMWIDEKDLKIYFVYQGHLLSLPLPKA